MSFRYKGARLSNTAPDTTSGLISGLYTLRQQLQGTPAASGGSQYYQTVGTFSWVAPANVTSVCAVCVGPSINWADNAYYGRGGGGLGWKNNITVIPGNSYVVQVGGSYGTDSFFIDALTVKGGCATGSSTGGTYVGDNGGNGGDGGANTGSGSGAGGGGAGGYAGNGGNGGNRGATSGTAAAASSGGGGGGAGGTSGSFGAGGGGVSVFGIGTTGTGGVYSAASSDPVSSGVGGSYGENGAASNTGGAYGPAAKGGGFAGTGASISAGQYSGAVRLIWNGLTFPSNAV